MITKYVECDCGNEILQITEDIEKGHNDQEFKMYYLSIYERGLNWNNEYGFWQRLKYCWHILKTGKPYADSMVLKRDKLDELIANLKDF